MEVGAVKQAFNNEIILLKKNLSQAKIQIINKMTRKAKTLTDKKAPEHLKEKLKKKAESAVREVLIIKKIKPKELGKFIVTHTGQLQQYLNRPQIDQDRACARLLLHKALQEKYKFIRSRFSDVPIKDLFMSRQERLKLKKEARELKKNKKDKKAGKVVNAHGDWDVENVKTDHEIDDNVGHEDDEYGSSDESGGYDDDEENNAEGSGNNEEPDLDKSQEIDDNMNKDDKEEDSGDDSEAGKFVKLKPIQVVKNKNKQKVSRISEKDTFRKDIEMKLQVIKEEIIKKQNKKPKDPNKNKNLNEKLQSRKFKKDSDELTVGQTKVVDPFFITSSGENYLSVAEPRQPDEVKEVHKQGNRQMRRAAMFGHVPKNKPKHNYYENNDRYSRINSYGNRPDNRYEKQNGFQKDKMNDRRGNNFKNDRFDRHDTDGYKKDFQDRNVKFKHILEETKPEKLHPSWEAKKKQSGILPFQGKKIVFSED